MPIRPNINQVRSLTDFTTSYQWYVTINPPRGVPFPTSNEINLRCISADIPRLNDQPLSTEIRGHKVWQPGIHVYTPTIVLTMAELIDMLVNNWIQRWREACWRSRTGIHQTKDNIEASITLVRLNRQDEPIWNYHLVGCFLSEYTQDTLGTSNELFRPALTITYDYFVDNRGRAPAPTGE